MGDGADATKRLAVELSDDGLVCRAVIHPGEPLHPSFVLEVDAALEQASIAARLVDRDAVTALVEAACAAPDETHSATIAEGTPPVKGLDASFELDKALAERLEEISQRKALYDGRCELDELPPEARSDPGAHAVDYRSQSCFVFVEEGDVLGTIRQTTAGEDGLSVRGETIRCKRGRSLSLAPDASIIIEETRVVAAVSGVLRARIGEVAVEPVLDIPDSVDFATGNIEFNGDVIVRGDVKDNFKIRAAGTLTIHGLVEAAHIHADGAISFVQGMAGREVGTVRAKGDLRAGYLDGVQGKVEGCCAVSSEIKECRLRVARTLDAPGCAVYGGKITVGREIRVGSLGSPGGIETLVAVGESPDIEALSARLADLHDQLRLRREQGENEYKALQDRQASLTPAQTERLTELQFEQITTAQLEKKITASTAELLDAARRWAPCRVAVSRGIYKGVRLRLRHAELTITQSVLGGAEFDLDPQGEPRCHLNGSPNPTPITSIASVSLMNDPFQVLERVSRDAA